jgi:hypothetical protein
MLNQGRFDHCFSAVSTDGHTPTPLTDYLQLPQTSTANKTPLINILADDINVTSLAVSQSAVDVIQAIAQRWQILQELAGEITPFTEKVRAEILKEVDAAHQQDMAALHQEYEQKIAAINANHHQETAQKVRTQLMTLAGYDPGLLDDKTVQ